MLLDGEISPEGQVVPGGMLESGFDFRSTFAEIILQIAIMGHESNLFVESSISPEVPRYILGDSKQLTELLLCLARYCLVKANGASISVYAEAPPTTGRGNRRQLDITVGYGPAEHYSLPLDDPRPEVRRTRSRARQGVRVSDAAGNLFKARRLAKLLNGEIKAVSLAEAGYAYRVSIGVEEIGTGPTLRRKAT